MDCKPPDSSVYGISQARILEWVAISYSRLSPQPRDSTSPVSFTLAGRFFTTEPPGKFSLILQSLPTLIKPLLCAGPVVHEVGMEHNCRGCGVSSTEQMFGVHQAETLLCQQRSI